jgi:predicted lipoprotein
MKKYLSISIISTLALIALYNSVYFEKLDAKKEKESVKDFDPKDKVEYFWENKLDEVLKSAINIELFDSQLKDSPESLMEQHGKAVGITSTYCFLVKGITKQARPGSAEIPVDIENSYADYNLKVKYIFGNTVRDATGNFNINDFENTMDFNAIASELNKIILKREIAKVNSLPPGETIQFIGAVEINMENISKQLDVIPIKLESSNGSKLHE